MTKSTGQRKTKVILNKQNKALALDLVDRGKPAKEVADKFHICRGSLYKYRKELKTDEELHEWVEYFRGKRADVKTLNQIRDKEIRDLVLDTFTPSAIKQATFNERTRLFKAVGEDERAEMEAEQSEFDKGTANEPKKYEIVLKIQAKEQEAIDVTNS